MLKMLLLIYCIILSPIILLQLSLAQDTSDIPCQWVSNSGANYDLRPLTRKPDEISYAIVDGDIPCTKEIEPSFHYSWNFCADITKNSIPNACTMENKHGGILQSFYVGAEEGEHFCYVIGQYDPAQDDSFFKQLDSTDPSKGVLLQYRYGDICDNSTRAMREATLEVQCANVKERTISAQEPNTCRYHIVVQSYYGCPLSCPISENGLCNSHGLCQFDSDALHARCFCNEGYYGEGCTEKDYSSAVIMKTIDPKMSQASASSSNVIISLLVTILIGGTLLSLAVIYIVYKISNRSNSSSYISLAKMDTEVVEREGLLGV